jgi:transcriptional regulator with XRE-family HTH domain
MIKNEITYENVDGMHIRLRRARKAAGFPAAIDAVRRFGWSISTYRAHENGQNAFNALTAIRYARAFKVAPTWLLLGDEALGGVGATVIDVPPTIDAAPDARAFQTMDGRALRPTPEAVVGDFSVPHDTRYRRNAQFVLLIEGESVNRVARDGDWLLCIDIEALPGPPAHGDLVLIECAGARAPEISIRRLHRIAGRLEFSFDSDDAVWRETMTLPDDAGSSAYGVRMLAKALFVFRRIDASRLKAGLTSDEIVPGVAAQTQKDDR